MKKSFDTITPLQLAAVMLCMSFSELAAFRPEGVSLTAAAFGELLVSAGSFLLLLPLCLGRKRAAPQGRLGAAVSLGALAFFMTQLSASLAVTVQYAFPRLYSSSAVILLTAAAGLYCASMGSRACAKTAAAAIVTAAGCPLLTAVGTIGCFRLVNICPVTGLPAAQLARALAAAAGRSGELAVFAVLLPETEGSAVRTAAVYSAVRAAAGTGVLLFAKGVLGVLAESGQPLFLLSSASKTAVIERFDAALLLVWVMCTVAACGAVLCAVRRCFCSLRADGRPPRLHTIAVFAALCAAAAFAAFAVGRASALSSGAAVSAVLPAAVLAGACLSRALRPRRENAPTRY